MCWCAAGTLGLSRGVYIYPFVNYIACSGVTVGMIGTLLGGALGPT